MSNAIVGQSGGCTAVINCSLLGVIREAQKSNKIDKLFGMWHGVEGLLKEDFTDLFSYDEKELEKLYHTPSAALGSCRYKLNEEDTENALEILKKHDIHYFFLIGGNDSADTTHKIAKKAAEVGYEINVIAVPKTIDNDLPITDHCPGYGSVARFIAQTTQEAGLDTKSMKGVDPFKIIEVMGRNSGWMVASSALGKRKPSDAPHLMYFPEVAFDQQKFLQDVEKVYNDFGYAVIVISETIKDQEGKRVGEKNKGVTGDSFGHGYVEGTSQVLCDMLEKHFGKRARFDKPGTIQRMSMAYISDVDQKEAFDLGAHAVKIALEGETDKMTILRRDNEKPYQVSCDAVSIAEIANIEKYMPEDFMNEEKNFVSQKFIDYALPLLGKPLDDFADLQAYEKGEIRS